MAEQRDEWLYLPRLVATGALVAVATGVRTGARHLAIGARHAPAVVHGVSASLPGAGDASAARNVLRGELVTIGRELAEATWFEARRAVDEFDEMSREDLPAASPVRPWRVKP